MSRAINEIKVSGKLFCQRCHVLGKRNNTNAVQEIAEVNTKNSQDKWRAESLILRHFHSSLLKDNFVTVRIVLRRFT